jgi:hypothetical protein
MPTTQERYAQYLGILPAGTAAPAVSTLALSAAATWLAFAFVPSESKTLNKVKIYVSAVSGTLTSFSCDVYSDSAGAPGSSLSSTSTVTTMPTTGSPGWTEFTGLSQALTAGTRYWLVFKNLTATPASNFPTVRFGNSAAVPLVLGGATAWGWGKKHSTDSGSTWAGTAIAGSFGWRLEYSDGSFDGLPIEDSSTMSVSTGGVYSTRESGAIFTTPANCNWKVRGVVMFAQKVGTPTGNLRFRLYQGTTLLATTDVIPAANITTNVLHAAYFSATQTLAPSTSYRVVLSESTQSDTSSNYYRSSEYLIENNADSKALFPWSIKRTYFDGASWTETDTSIPFFGLIGDTDGEFASSGGGSIVLSRGIMSGGRL